MAGPLTLFTAAGQDGGGGRATEWGGSLLSTAFFGVSLRKKVTHADLSIPSA